MSSSGSADSSPALRARATQVLVLATAFWGLSFPAMKALSAAQQADGMTSSWFLASTCVVVRFGVSALAMLGLALAARSLGRFTRLEWEQGLGLGLFGGLGLLLQVDGLHYTSASTSAFLTQGYCLWLPLWTALHDRRWPAGRVVLSCGMVVAGVMVLAEVDWRRFHLGRGELETILASLLFTGQILWLERPRYAGNNVTHFSMAMFLVIAAVCLPVALASTASARDWVRAYDSVPEWGMMAILVGPCTLGAYLMMNHWQRHVPATHAGLIYCLEPVCTSVYALFLPGWLSLWAGVAYANERLTMTLLVGGGLITLANVLLHLPVKGRGTATA
jgi:drug/metabolite transporter (DMT)-like permease